jgi:UDPglucose 6-dehydrogenase
MKIGIVGVGFVGGSTARVLHPHHQVYLYDKYQTPKWCTEKGNEWANPPINSSQSLETLAKESEVVFISVPTPMQPSGAIDYTNIHSSVNQLLDYTKGAGRNPQDLLVVIRSTAVSGTTDKLAEQYPFRFAFNPEFLREKHALEDMKNTDRVVLGANDQRSLEQAAAVYKPVFPNARFILTNTKTAEMIKYMANGMLTGQVALANEFYQICKAVGIDYDSVKQAVLLDPRIGRNLDVPGPDGDLGFGGKCFPKDLNALIHLARERMYRPHLLEEVWRLNEKVRTDLDWLNIDGATSRKNFGESAK